MLRQRIEIHSRCQHCGEPLIFSADAPGPDAGAAELMVWIGQQDDDAGRPCTFL